MLNLFLFLLSWDELLWGATLPSTPSHCNSHPLAGPRIHRKFRSSALAQYCLSQDWYVFYLNHNLSSLLPSKLSWETIFLQRAWMLLLSSTLPVVKVSTPAVQGIPYLEACSITDRSSVVPSCLWSPSLVIRHFASSFIHFQVGWIFIFTWVLQKTAWPAWTQESRYW